MAGTKGTLKAFCHFRQGKLTMLASDYFLQCFPYHAILEDGLPELQIFFFVSIANQRLLLENKNAPVK
jgi:hypothetical protein